MSDWKGTKGGAVCVYRPSTDAAGSRSLLSALRSLICAPSGGTGRFDWLTVPMHTRAAGDVPCIRPAQRLVHSPGRSSHSSGGRRRAWLAACLAVGEGADCKCAERHVRVESDGGGTPHVARNPGLRRSLSDSGCWTRVLARACSGASGADPAPAALHPGRCVCLSTALPQAPLPAPVSHVATRAQAAKS